MSQPRWLDMRISLGHIAQAVILAVGIGAAYQGLSAKQDALKAEIDTQKAALAAYQRADVAAARESVLLEVLNEVKQRLERIEKKIDSR